MAIIKNIHPALKILSSKNKSLLIAQTNEGTRLVYLPDIALDKSYFNKLKREEPKNILGFPQNSEGLIQKLYQESLNFLKGSFSQTHQYLHIFIDADFSRIIDDLIRIKKEQETRFPLFWNFQLKVIPENMDSLFKLVNEISAVQETDETLFNSRFSLQLLILYDPGWGCDLPCHLEDMISHYFINTAIYITESAVLEEPTKLLQWLDLIQNSGLSLPVLFATPQIMISKQGENIIETIIQSSIARYIGIDPVSITGLKNHREKKEYMENYSHLIYSWIQKQDSTILGLRDFILLFSTIMEPLRKRFVFLGKKSSFFKLDGSDQEKWFSLWKEFSSYSELLGNLFPRLLPFHFYEETSGGIKTIPKDLVFDYARIYENCTKFLIKAIFKECEESIEGNRPLSLDLNLEKPVYHLQDWKKARTVIYSAENES